MINVLNLSCQQSTGAVTKKYICVCFRRPANLKYFGRYFLVDMEMAKHTPKNMFPQANINLNYSPSLGQKQK